MVILTVIRRTLILLCILGLVIDGALLVYAKSAQSNKGVTASGSYQIKFYVDSKPAAEDIKKVVAAEKISPPPDVKMSQVTRVRRDPTGQWIVAMRFKALDGRMVDSAFKALRAVSVPVTKERLEDGGSLIKVNQVFKDKDEAERKAAEISRKGPFQLAAEEATRKVTYPAYKVEVTVSDSSTADSLRDKVISQNNKAQVEQ
jgi:hypothetical protein